MSIRLPSAQQERLRAWLGLHLERELSPTQMWEAIGPKLDPVPLWRSLTTVKKRERVEQVLGAATANSVQVVTWDDLDYPTNVRYINSPPAVLFVRGSILPMDAAAVAIVGTRRASTQAEELAFVLARDLVAVGVTVISGLAVGVDAAAHRGALSANGRTVAVVAGGADTIYPKRHAALAASVVSSGALISPFPCGTAPKRSHFPHRNRLMAAISLGVIVVEAPARSGALITAHAASGMGREVMVCPGDPLREHCRGSNGLLREGARAIMAAVDVITDLAPELRAVLDRIEERQPKPGRSNAPVGSSLRLWSALQTGPGTVDQLARRANMDSASARRELSYLELRGLAQRCMGDTYNVAPAPK